MDFVLERGSGEVDGFEKRELMRWYGRAVNAIQIQDFCRYKYIIYTEVGFPFPQPPL